MFLPTLPWHKHKHKQTRSIQLWATLGSRVQAQLLQRAAYAAAERTAGTARHFKAQPLPAATREPRHAPHCSTCMLHPLSRPPVMRILCKHGARMPCASAQLACRAACSARQPCRGRCSLPARRRAGWRACSPGRRGGGGGSALARAARCRPRWRPSRSPGGTPRPRAGVRPRSRQRQTRRRRPLRPSAPVPCPLVCAGGCGGDERRGPQ